MLFWKAWGREGDKWENAVLLVISPTLDIHFFSSFLTWALTASCKDFWIIFTTTKYFQHYIVFLRGHKYIIIEKYD